MFLKTSQISQENTCGGSLFNKVAGLKAFACEYCKIFRTAFFYRTPPVAASVNLGNTMQRKSQMLVIKRKPPIFQRLAPRKLQAVGF